MEKEIVDDYEKFVLFMVDKYKSFLDSLTDDELSKIAKAIDGVNKKYEVK